MNKFDYIPPLVYATAVALRVLVPEQTKLIRLLEAEAEAFCPALKQEHVEQTKPEEQARVLTRDDLQRLAAAVAEEKPENRQEETPHINVYG